MGSLIVYKGCCCSGKTFLLFAFAPHTTNMETVDKSTFLFKHPFTCMISGSSSCGKTVFTLKLVKNITSMCDIPPKQIYWAYSEWQPAYQDLCTIPNVQMIQGLPSLETLKANPTEPKLLVLDDLMLEGAKKNDFFTQLFVRGSHHWNLSCCLLVQSAFYEGLKTPRRNSHYMVLFRNPADQLQVSILARQIFPQQTKYFLESYKNATAQPHSYLLLDLKQTCPDNFRLRTNIFPGQPTIVYLPK